MSRPARAAALAATLGFAAASWVVALRAMDGMDMGAATELGPLGSFMAVWAPMMAAMMLPSAAPAVSRTVGTRACALAPALFALSCLAVWALAGLAVYALYRPHGTLAAGIVTVAAGVYELTPFKRACRRRCRARLRSGLGFGLACVGSSAGLMAILVALGVMSVALTAVAAAVVLAQKLLPPIVAIDVPLALAIVGLGVAVVLD